MAQSKEEVILSRLTELGIRLALFKVQASKVTEEQKQIVQNLIPEQILARYSKLNCLVSLRVEDEYVTFPVKYIYILM
jgi:hypothetical protein